MVGRLIREARQTNKLGHRKKLVCKFWLKKVSIVPLKQPEEGRNSKPWQIENGIVQLDRRSSCEATWDLSGPGYETVVPQKKTGHKKHT